MSQDITYYNSGALPQASPTFAYTTTATGRIPSGGNVMTKALQAVYQYGKGSLTIGTYKGMTEDEVREQISAGGTKEYPAPTIIAIIPVFIHG